MILYRHPRCDRAAQLALRQAPAGPRSADTSKRISGFCFNRNRALDGRDPTPAAGCRTGVLDSLARGSAVIGNLPSAPLRNALSSSVSSRSRRTVMCRGCDIEVRRSAAPSIKPLLTPLVRSNQAVRLSVSRGAIAACANTTPDVSSMSSISKFEQRRRATPIRRAARGVAEHGDDDRPVRDGSRFNCWRCGLRGWRHRKWHSAFFRGHTNGGLSYALRGAFSLDQRASLSPVSYGERLG